MNVDIFSWWINEFESLMYQAGRKVLLFMDNATVHNIVEQIKLRAVKVVFFPKNNACCTQPCDAGVLNQKYLQGCTTIFLDPRLSSTPSYRGTFCLAKGAPDMRGFTV